MLTSDELRLFAESYKFSKHPDNPSFQAQEYESHELENPSLSIWPDAEPRDRLIYWDYTGTAAFIPCPPNMDGLVRLCRLLRIIR